MVGVGKGNRSGAEGWQEEGQEERVVSSGPSLGQQAAWSESALIPLAPAGPGKPLSVPHSEGLSKCALHSCPQR